MKSGFFEGTGTPDPGWWEALWPDPARVLVDVGIANGMRVIEYAVAMAGSLSHSQRSRAQSSPSILTVSYSRRRRCDLPNAAALNVVLIEADAYQIARVVHDPVDHLFLANAFHGVPDKPRLARTVYDVLKPGGFFAIVNWHARPREDTMVLGQPRGPASELRMTPEATMNTVVPSGFKLRMSLKSRPITTAQYSGGKTRNRSRTDRLVWPEALLSRCVMTGAFGPVEHELFLIGSGDTGSYSQTTMVLIYGRIPRK